MYSISKLGELYNLSRSALLYYESIGLLRASSRTALNYRVYTKGDEERLRMICSYREAGVPLEQIKELLDYGEISEQRVLEERLLEVNKEIRYLRLQQKIIVEMLKNKNINNKAALLNKGTFVEVLRASGLNNELQDNLHIEFEKYSPSEHQIFLEFLGIAEEEIKEIRQHASKNI